ncbi:MAG TPA: hypothetical protein VL651_09055 [Bacteroidia bacterium]|jgi:hypothetical protein|nr:hypothetical protein [Bacteroidia bacterium]
MKVQTDSTNEIIANHPVISDSITNDTSLFFSDLMGLAMEAYYNIDFESIDRMALDDSKKTGFDFCLFSEKSTDGDIVYGVHRDSTGCINLIEQIPVIDGYLKCKYYVYTSKKSHRFSFLFVKEQQKDGSSTLLDGCVVRDARFNKLMFLCWNKPNQYMIRNLASVMMLDCQTLDVKSYARLVSGGIKYFARIDNRKDGTYKNCYVQNTKPIGKFEMNEFYKLLESPVEDSLFYLSVTVNAFDGKSNYPLWYKNAYFLLVGDSGDFPEYHMK